MKNKKTLYLHGSSYSVDSSNSSDKKKCKDHDDLKKNKGKQFNLLYVPDLQFINEVFYYNLFKLSV